MHPISSIQRLHRFHTRCKAMRVWPEAINWPLLSDTFRKMSIRQFGEGMYSWLAIHEGLMSEQ